MSTFDWQLRPSPTPDELTPLGDLEPVIASILWHRGVRTSDDVARFFEPDFDSHLHNPFLFKYMPAVIERLAAAIKKRERIIIHGDYDADGVTSTAILVEALRTFGAVVDWFVPDRFKEGYGLRGTTVERFASEGYQVLIAIDCGTTNVQEIAIARQRGLDVIIMDHHQPAAERPDALMLNPSMPDDTYPFAGLSSAGVAYAFIRAMMTATDRGKKINHPVPDGWEKWLLDLVAISTVADLMPLRDENRTLVRYGLLVLRKTRRPGLRALLGRIGATDTAITEQTIGYHIGPRLNAAGRLRHAGTAVRLLLTQDRTEAEALVDELEQINADRQRLTAAATEEAWEQIKQSPETQGAYAVYAPHWSPGILGLVAGRLTEKLWKPVAVMTDLDGGIVGSVRSVAGINIMTTMTAGAKFFTRFGGHPGAGGFSLTSDQCEPFRTWFAAVLPADLASSRQRPLVIDLKTPLVALNDELLKTLDRLAPYGVEHPRPIFLVERLVCQGKTLAGADHQHLRIQATQDGQRVAMIGFRLAPLAGDVAPQEAFDAVVEPTWNTWNGKTEIQLRIIDLRRTT